MEWEQAHGPVRIRLVLGVVAIVVAAVVLLLIIRPAPGGTLTVAPTVRPQPTVAATPAQVSPRDLPSAEAVAASAGSGSLLPDGADFTIIAADGAGWRVIDIATGDITRWHLSRAGERVPSRVMFVSGDDLVVNLGLGPSDILRIAPDGRTTRIARQRQAIPTLDDAAVWVHDGLSDDFGGFLSLVDPDGTVREHITLPSLTRPAVGTADGLFVTTEMGTALVSNAGTRWISDTGTIAAADATRVAHATCDATPACEIVLGTIQDADGHRVTLPPGDIPGGSLGPGLGAFSGDGHWLALPVFTRGAGSYVSIIDALSGLEVGGLPGSAQPFTSALAWSPDGRWLLVASDEGIAAWRGYDGRVVAIDVPSEQAIQALAVR
jgi:hypothetical protein